MVATTAMILVIFTDRFLSVRDNTGGAHVSAIATVCAVAASRDSVRICNVVFPTL
jgi:hypothetical protein